jgi:hypothetical protein
MTGTGETFVLRKLVALCSHLSTLASHSVDLSPIVAVLASGIGGTVAVVDPALEVLAVAGPDTVTGPGTVTGPEKPAEILAQLQHTALTAAARNRRALAVPGAEHGQVILIAPVFVAEDVGGYLVTFGAAEPDGDFTEDMRLLAAEHAAMVCGLVLGRDLVVAAAAGRARQELLEGLLRSRDRDNPEVERWARHLGLDPAREHYVMSFEVPQKAAEHGPSSIELPLTRNAPGAVLASREDEVVAIVPVAGDGTSPVEQGRALAMACLAADGQRPVITGVGIGNPGARAADIARSYAEARRALAAGRRMGQAGTVATFADLGIHRLLLRVPDVGDLRSFADEVLGGLAEEERSTCIDYLATLSAYFRENGSPARAAQRLHVHPNTVSYRIRRAEELTGLSFSVHRDRLMAEVAVEILEGL